jgi:hypothetical protein
MRILGKIALSNVIKMEGDGMVSLFGWDSLGRAWTLTTDYGDGSAPDKGWSREDLFDMIAVCGCSQGCVCDEDYRAAREHHAAMRS